MDLTSFIKVGNNREEAYKDYIDFEKGWKFTEDDKPFFDCILWGLLTNS